MLSNFGMEVQAGLSTDRFSNSGPNRLLHKIQIGPESLLGENLMMSLMKRSGGTEGGDWRWC